MNEFECYSLYTALKLHFTTDYDYFKYNGKCKVSPDSFNRRRERFFFKKLSREYNDADLKDFLVSNIQNDINTWIGDAFGEKCVTTYREWKKRIQSLQYVFKEDCNKIIKSDDPNAFDSLFEVEEGQHPAILRYALAKTINIETFIMLNDVLGFIPKFNRQIRDKLIWPEYRTKCMKYKPFFNHDFKSTKKTLKKVLDI